MEDWIFLLMIAALFMNALGFLLFALSLKNMSDAKVANDYRKSARKKKKKNAVLDDDDYEYEVENKLYEPEVDFDENEEDEEDEEGYYKLFKSDVEKEFFEDERFRGLIGEKKRPNDDEDDDDIAIDDIYNRKTDDEEEEEEGFDMFQYQSDSSNDEPEESDQEGYSMDQFFSYSNDENDNEDSEKDEPEFKIHRLKAENGEDEPVQSNHGIEFKITDDEMSVQEEEEKEEFDFTRYGEGKEEESQELLNTKDLLKGEVESPFEDEEEEEEFNIKSFEPLKYQRDKKTELMMDDDAMKNDIEQRIKRLTGMDEERIKSKKRKKLLNTDEEL